MHHEGGNLFRATDGSFRTGWSGSRVLMLANKNNPPTGGAKSRPKRRGLHAVTLVDKSSTRKVAGKGVKKVPKASSHPSASSSQKPKRGLTPAAQLMERLSEEVEQDYIAEAERLSLALDRALKRSGGRR